MNQKSVILNCLLILSLFAVFISGCISESNDSLNPLNKNIENFTSASPGNILRPEDSGMFYQVNLSIAPNTPAELIEKSDLIFYGTVKEITPSFWTTEDGKAPDGLFAESDSVYHINSDEIILTNIVFTPEEIVRGNVSGDVTVCFYGGEVDNFIMYFNSGEPSPWDFESGEEYLLYLTPSSADNDVYFVMSGGIFKVIQN